MSRSDAAPLPRRLAWLTHLLATVAGSPVTELEVELPGLRVQLRRRPGRGAARPAVAPAGATVAEGVTPAPDLITIRTPVTGIFYAGPDPRSEPYVQVGELVEVEQIVGLVEAMKIFNEIRADYRGVVERFAAQNGQLIQADQPILMLRATDEVVLPGPPLAP